MEDDKIIYEGVDEGKAFPLHQYNPMKDLAPVDPYGFIDLRSAYENHSVPTVVADEIVNYNGIDDPESIMGTPRDIFEAYRMNDAIRKYDAKVSSEKDKTS